MSHLDQEMKRLRDEMIRMMFLVWGQLEKGKYALIDFDESIANEILSTEKIINATELKIDSDCENILALYNPVAIDLRFVMACFKINTHLERIGDNVESIAKFILSVDNKIDAKILERFRFEEMYEFIIEMVNDVIEAFENEDTKLARRVFKKDKVINEINSNASRIVFDLIKKQESDSLDNIYLLSIMRKLERIGDLTKNIGEEIIFYVEAKVMKHRKEMKKSGKTKL